MRLDRTAEVFSAADGDAAGVTTDHIDSRLVNKDPDDRIVRSDDIAQNVALGRVAAGQVGRSGHDKQPRPLGANRQRLLPTLGQRNIGFGVPDLLGEQTRLDLVCHLHRKAAQPERFEFLGLDRQAADQLRVVHFNQRRSCHDLTARGRADGSDKAAGPGKHGRLFGELHNAL